MISDITFLYICAYVVALMHPSKKPPESTFAKHDFYSRFGFIQRWYKKEFKRTLKSSEKLHTLNATWDNDDDDDEEEDDDDD